MPRLRAWIMVGIFMVAPLTSATAETHFFQKVIDARGGCGNVHTINMRVARSSLERKLFFGETDINLFGRPILKWSDNDIAEAVRIFKECWIKKDTSMGSRGLSPFGKTAIRGFERDLREVITEARNVQSRKEAKEAAQIEIKKTETKHKLEQAEEDYQRKQERLREQAQRDREAAEELRKLAEREAPKIAEATKQADEAQRARGEAEQKLAEIRNNIARQERARNESIARSQAADRARQEELQRQTQPAPNRETTTLDEGYQLMAIVAVYNDACERVSDETMRKAALFGALSGIVRDKNYEARLMLKVAEVNGVLKTVGRQHFCQSMRPAVERLARS